MNGEATQDQGFTLLELLVAMALLGLLSLVLWGGLRFGTQVWRISGDDLEHGNKVRSVQAQLTRQITTAYPAFLRTDATHAVVAFDGGRDRLDFLTLDPMKPGSMVSVTLDAPMERGRREMRSRTHGELVRASNPETRILLKDLKSLEFSYFGTETLQDSASWHADWHDKMKPPQLVRIRVEFADRKSDLWPELIIAPRITADAACAFDAVTKYCKGR